MTSTSPLVELRGVGVRAGYTPILAGLDLTVRPGEVAGVAGANGSGKTTLLRVLATLLRPSDGTGSVLGADLRSPDRARVRPRIGYIGHVPALYPELTLEENTEFVARVTGRNPSRIEEVLDAVGLARARHRRADACSHGMQRRAEFARLLLTEPDLLLLDEAHAGLDRHAADLVALLVGRVRAAGGAAVLVSHEADRIAPLLDRSYELAGGTLAAAEAA